MIFALTLQRDVLAEAELREDGSADHSGVFLRRAPLGRTPASTESVGPRPLCDLADAALLVAIANGRDQAAFAELFSRYAPKLIAHFSRTPRERARAEDLAQDVMLSVWANAASYRAELAAPSTWIFRIARNRHIDVVRRQRHIEVEPDDCVLTDSSPALDEQVGSQHFGERMVAALADLPEEQAEVVRGSYFQHETAVEISARLEVPVGTVKSRLRAALSQLRVRMFVGGEP